MVIVFLICGNKFNIMSNNLQIFINRKHTFFVYDNNYKRMRLRKEVQCEDTFKNEKKTKL